MLDDISKQEYCAGGPQNIRLSVQFQDCVNSSVWFSWPWPERLKMQEEKYRHVSAGMKMRELKVRNFS